MLVVQFEDQAGLLSVSFSDKRTRMLSKTVSIDALEKHN